ncbi:GTP:AMP phosphotransferase AK3, mitochondrial [Toxorhynchites rutilus septentrionalis]|uniref:GTP:AMP phosphotransferase AK3, mitochondrial n=1 Tax=Toxorhynchites rutilus septentrionalis TaxID=329112 RepID=UPI00247904DE|nr:GTP:AMP phosphotransferase AK3, mitochondrial [Toxorhynchites rutilus septentrionalis]
MNSNLIRAVIMGAPGSGKGTVSARLVKTFNMHHISSGDLLRSNIEQKTELGRIADKYIKEGKLVPDVYITQCILGELDKIRTSSWLLDGFPRTPEQAEDLWQAEKIDTVINLDVPFDVIIDRLKSRWVHLPSGRVYNIGFNDPKVRGVDDITGEPLSQRPDDNPAAVRKRLEIYDACTRPLNEYFRKKGVLVTFSGRTTNEIWPNVKKYFDGKFR